MLPTDPKARKALPVMTGVIDYFPDAIAEIAAVSKAGNDQHNPGQPLQWSKGKSADHADTMLRHFMERKGLDTDGQRHAAKAAWRALAFLQTLIEAERAGMDYDAYVAKLQEAEAEKAKTALEARGAGLSRVSRDTLAGVYDASPYGSGEAKNRLDVV